MAARSSAVSLDDLQKLVDQSLKLLQELTLTVRNIETQCRLLDQPPPSARTEQEPSESPASASPSSASAHASQGVDQPSPAPFEWSALARDSTSLIKAHSTKLLLLMSNEPFTPSAISVTVRQLVTGAVPALVHAVQNCDPAVYTCFYTGEVASYCASILGHTQTLLSKIPYAGKALVLDKKSTDPNLLTIGLGWHHHDRFMKILQQDFRNYLVESVKGCQTAILGAVDEMKDHREALTEGAQADANEEAVVADAVHDSATAAQESNGNVYIEAQAMIDDLVESNAVLPPGDPDKIVPRLDSSIRRMKLTSILFSTLIKRRLLVLPDSFPYPGTLPDVVKRLDDVMPYFSKIEADFDNLACAFYDMETEQIRDYMDKCFYQVFALSEMLAKSWDGERDEFTVWAARFQLEIRKP